MHKWQHGLIRLFFYLYFLNSLVQVIGSYIFFANQLLISLEDIAFHGIGILHAPTFPFSSVKVLRIGFLNRDGRFSSNQEEALQLRLHHYL